jgi:TonB family protein
MLVQRKVDRNWREPEGVLLDPENNAVDVAVWVNRQGQLLSDPMIVRDAGDPALGASAIAALRAAAPFPPFPEDFREPEQQVIFTFTLD